MMMEAFILIPTAYKVITIFIMKIIKLWEKKILKEMDFLWTKEKVLEICLREEAAIIVQLAHLMITIRIHCQIQSKHLIYIQSLITY